jgi:hypothetical protein
MYPGKSEGRILDRRESDADCPEMKFAAEGSYQLRLYPNNHNQKRKRVGFAKTGSAP